MFWKNLPTASARFPPHPSGESAPSASRGSLTVTHGHSPGGQTRPSLTCGSPVRVEGRRDLRVLKPNSSHLPCPLGGMFVPAPGAGQGGWDWLSSAFDRKGLEQDGGCQGRGHRWLPGSPKPCNQPHARIHNQSPSLGGAPPGNGLAAVCPSGVGASAGEGTPPTACLCSRRRAGRGAAGPHLEVRAIVVVLVHDLPLSAAPGQHGDHLPPRQVRVEL